MTNSAKRVTLQDVAAASGVSRATASVVMRDSHDIAISATTRERVQKAARELGYVPHGVARALREGSTRIVVLCIDIGQEGNYSRGYIRGLDAELARHDHVLLVRHGTPSPEATQQLLDTVAPRAVLEFARGYLEPGHELDDGGWNGGLAGNTAVQFWYLADRGHTDIALALPDGDPPLGALRQRFADEAAETLGLNPPQSLRIPRDRTECASAVKEFRDAQPTVTAVAAFDDDTAIRILTALADLGLTAPDDLAVIGFDDGDHGALTTPALTTVHIDAEGHGRNAAHVILGSAPDNPSTPAPPQIIIRQSA